MQELIVVLTTQHHLHPPQKTALWGSTTSGIHTVIPKLRFGVVWSTILSYQTSWIWFNPGKVLCLRNTQPIHAIRWSKSTSENCEYGGIPPKQWAAVSSYRQHCQTIGSQETICKVEYQGHINTRHFLGADAKGDCIALRWDDSTIRIYHKDMTTFHWASSQMHPTINCVSFLSTFHWALLYKSRAAMYCTPLVSMICNVNYY